MTTLKAQVQEFQRKNKILEVELKEYKDRVFNNINFDLNYTINKSQSILEELKHFLNLTHEDQILPHLKMKFKPNLKDEV